MAERRFDPASFAVDPSLAGSRLPSPRRRAAAFAVDYLLLLVPTLATAIGFAAFALRFADPVGYQAVRTAIFAFPAEPAAEHELWRDLVPVLTRIEADGLPAAVAADVEAGALDRAADRMRDLELFVTLDVGGAESKPLPPKTVRLAVERLIPSSVRTAALFFVPAIYFAVATSVWGTTIGKRLFGLRVARLDGHRLSLFDSMERFGAYFGILGTLGLGLLDLWKDPNRRLGHDRAVDTVVVRRERKRDRRCEREQPGVEPSPSWDAGS